LQRVAPEEQASEALGCDRLAEDDGPYLQEVDIASPVWILTDPTRGQQRRLEPLRPLKATSMGEHRSHRSHSVREIPFL